MLLSTPICRNECIHKEKTWNNTKFIYNKGLALKLATRACKTKPKKLRFFCVFLCVYVHLELTQSMTSLLLNNGGAGVETVSHKAQDDF